MPGDQRRISQYGEGDIEHLSLARQDSSDPNLDVRVVFLDRPIKVQLGLFQNRAMVAGGQQSVQEILQMFGPVPPVLGADVQAKDGSPGVAPAAGEHARPDRVMHRQEAKDVLEDAVRQSADPIFAARHGRFTGLAVARQAVEQVVSTTALDARRRLASVADAQGQGGGADAKNRPTLTEKTKRVSSLYFSSRTRWSDGMVVWWRAQSSYYYY